MTIDAAHSSLVTQEYRYAIVQDATIKGLYPDAQEVTLNTNLDATGGVALATGLFNQVKGAGLVFSLTVEGVLYLEDFTTSPNRYTVLFAKHPAASDTTVFYVIGAEIDYGAGRTTLTVRG